MKKSTVSAFVIAAFVCAPTFFGSAQAQSNPTALQSAQSAQAATCISYNSVAGKVRDAFAAVGAAETNLKTLQAANGSAGAIQQAKDRLADAQNNYMVVMRTLMTVQGQYDHFAQIIYDNHGYNVCKLAGAAYM